jgi:probable rRNA maturation factor
MTVINYLTPAVPLQIDLGVTIDPERTATLAAFDLSTLIPEATWTHWFQTWMNHLGPTWSPIHAYGMSLLLTDDVGIQAYNSSYRHQDVPTDVLAFAALDGSLPASELWEAEPWELGDVIISAETGDRQRLDHGFSLTQELAWLATHGFLHLLGWDHPDERRLVEMLDCQRILLKQVQLLN